MIKLDKISYNTRSAECNDLCTSIAQTLKQAAMNDPHLSAIVAEIIKGNHALLTSIKKDKAESQLEELDTDRDGTYRSLFYLTKGYVHHPDAKISESAAVVEDVMDKYGLELASATYSAESALLDSFMADMAKPELATVIELLPGVKSLSEKLDLKQSTFKAAENDLLNARSAEQSTANATTAKKELVKIVNDKLVVYLRAMLQVMPDQYTALASKIELLIEKSNGIVKRRRTSLN